MFSQWAVVPLAVGCCFLEDTRADSTQLPSAQSGMVILTRVPRLFSMSRSSGSAVAYIMRRPNLQWVSNFRPNFPTSVATFLRPLPLVGTPVPETSSRTAMAVAAYSVFGWGLCVL